MDNNQATPTHNDDPMIGKLIFDRFKLLKRLGAGSFGSIYSAEYENQLYAIKLEEKVSGQNLLENEAYIMSYLNGPGLPFVKSYGYSSKHYILVMELMGKSLEDIFESFVVKKMSIRCVCNIGYQMVEILEYIHNKHVIHRDIKPDNFVIGRNEKRKYIYILDFGLSKKYRSSKTLKHYPIIKSKNLTGTARYASINALNGLSQSRRDDLEAVGYVLMYFLRGKLPWQGIPVKNREDRYRKIMEKKIATSPEELCNGFPSQFCEYIKYTRNLLYEQDPNYDYLRSLFTSVLSAERLGIDCYYDWDKETINYFRDFKNIYNKNDDKNNNNYNNNEPAITNNNKQINGRDVNNYTKDKYPYITHKYSGNNNSTSYNAKTQGNSNSVSMVNNQGNKGSCLYGSNNNDISGIGQKQNNQETINGNEIIKDYNQDKKIENQNQNNNDENAELRNNLGNKENIKELNNNNNLDQQNLNQQNNFVENNGQENNNEQMKFGGMNPRHEKDNKCCSIF